MIGINPSVDEIVADIIDAKRHMVVEDAVDEYLLAERDILTEATTAADKIADMNINDAQYLEDDEEINQLIDSSINDAELEDEEFQDTLEEYGIDDEDDLIENVEDVIDDDIPYNDLDAMIADGADIDSLM